MKVRIGNHDLEMGGKYLKRLRESTEIKDDFDALRKRLEEDGYLFIRGFHDREQVLRARAEITGRLAEMGRLKPGTDPMDGILADENKGGAFFGTNEDMPEFLSVVNSPRVMDFFANLLGGPVITYDYKWLRAIPREGSTGAHYDIVYMGRGTPNLYTVWTPFGDTPIELGTLAILEGSHRWERVRETYGKLDVDRDRTEGWFSTDAVEMVDKFGGIWATDDFRAGDAILFGMFTMHGSTANTTDRMRISCDTRYQLASEPVDERWIGKKPKGHVPLPPEKTMKEARKEWGFE